MRVKTPCSCAALLSIGALLAAGDVPAAIRGVARGADPSHGAAASSTKRRSSTATTISPSSSMTV